MTLHWRKSIHLCFSRKLIEIYDTSRGVQVDAIELYDLEYPYKVSFCPETEEAFILGTYLEQKYLHIIEN